MRSIFTFIAFFLAGLSALSLQAQEPVKRCGTDDVLREWFATHPGELQSLVANEQAYDVAMQNKGKSPQSTTVYTIPVVFHVLHQNGPENISDAQIFDAISILNRDMRKLNPDTITIIPKFQPLLSDIRIEFRLAKLDPQGNCTNGIDRIYTSKTNYGDDSAKVNPWPRDRYLNIWTAKNLLQGWAGYAYYPSAATGSLSVHDGLMVLADYVGSIGTSTPYKSRTITHEVGHWLDLGHPWNTTINISINVGLACGDDLVNDTPITKGHTTCPDLLTPDCMISPFTNGVFDFSSVTTSSGANDPTASHPDYDSLSITPFAAVGLSGNAAIAGEFSFTGWPTGAANGATSYASLSGSLDPARYYEVTLVPKPSSSMSLTGIKFNINRSATGPRTYALRSSRDGFAANLTASLTPANPNLSVQAGNVFFYNTDASSSEAGSAIVLSGAPFTNESAPITFRLYAWNAEDNLGSFSIDDVSLQGSTGVIENIQNYMEYSYCTNMFTTGQQQRMRTAVESAISGRSNLWSAANLALTGVSAPTTTCAPKPDFYASNTRICKGNQVTFTKSVMNGAETSRSWTFQGGTPPTSTAVSPVVTYSAAGVYSVSLSTTNAAGTGTISKVQYIRVDNTTADIPFSGSYTEGFESPTILDYTWQVNDIDNNGHKWSYAAGAGTNGSNAAGLNAFGNYREDLDELISPSFDLTNAQNKSFTFKVASASTAAPGIDSVAELKVFFSTNCGNSWALRGTYNRANLFNNPASTSAFVPSGSTVWTQKSISIPSIFQTSNVRVKFQYRSSYTGNNIYIDDVNISETVGIDEMALEEGSLTLFPNPTSGSANLRYTLASDATVSLQIMDLLGKQVHQSAPSRQNAGEHAFTFSKQSHGLGNGIYLVKLTVDGHTQVRKLIVGE